MSTGRPVPTRIGPCDRGPVDRRSCRGTAHRNRTDDLLITREFHTPKAVDWPASTASTKATQVSQHDQIEVMYAQNTPTPEAARGLDARGSRQVTRHSMPPSHLADDGALSNSGHRCGAHHCPGDRWEFDAQASINAANEARTCADASWARDTLMQPVR